MFAKKLFFSLGMLEGGEMWRMKMGREAVKTEEHYIIQILQPHTTKPLHKTFSVTV